MSDRRGRSQADRSRSSNQTPSRAPSRSRRELSRDRQGAPRSTGSANQDLGSDSDRNPRYYPPPAGGRSGSSSALNPRPPVGPGGASSIDLPVYVGYSDTSSKAELLYESSASMPGTPPRLPSTTARAGPSAPRPHDLPPSRPTSSNPARPLPGRTGSGPGNDPTAPGGSFPGPPSWQQGSTRFPPSTVSNYPDHGHTPASQSAPSHKSEDSLYFSKHRYFHEPDPYEDNKHDSFRPQPAGTSSLGIPYTGNRFLAGHKKLPSDPPHPGEIYVPGDSTGLSQAQSRPSDYSGQWARAPSPYSVAAKAEKRQTERRSREGGWPARGGSDPELSQNYTQASHMRLAAVARRSANEWTAMKDGERASKNSSRKDSHERYVEMMEEERVREDENPRP